MKKILALLLALIMCLSLFVSCAKSDEKGTGATTTNNNGDPNAPSATIDNEKAAAAINKFDLKNFVKTTIDSVFSDDSQTQLNGFIEELAKLNGEANLSMTFQGETSPIYLGLKDNVVKTQIGQSGAYLCAKDGTVISAIPYKTGYIISTPSSGFGADEVPALSTDLSQYEEMVNMYVTEDVLKALEGFKLDVKADQLTEKDGFAFLSDDVFTGLGDQILDLVIEVMKALDAPAEELPTPEDTAEAKAAVKSFIESLDLKLGFAFNEDIIVGVTFSITIDTEKIYEITANEEAVPFTEGDVVDETGSTLKMDFTSMYSDDGKLPKSFDCALDIDSDSEGHVIIEYNFDYIYNANKALTGSNINAEITVKDTFVYYDYNKEIDVYGDQKTVISSAFDKSKLTETGSTVIDLKLTMNTVPTKYQTYNSASDKYEEITDAAVIKALEDTNPYIKKAAFNFTAKVNNTGVLDISSKIEGSYDGKTFDDEYTQTVKGTFSWTAAPNYGTLPTEIREGIINNATLLDSIAAIEEYASKLVTESPDILNEAIKNFGNGATIAWQDTASGLWALVYCYDISDVSIYTVQPEADVIINAN